MSIPKEPRQLMINLMYLVLTALLALNVSAEVMNAFFSLDKGLASSRGIVDKGNEALMNSITSTAEAYNTPANQNYKQKAEEANRLAQEFQAYVEGMRTKLFEAAKGPSKYDPTIPKDMKNKDLTTRMFVKEKLGDEIEAKINEYRKKFLDLTENDPKVKIPLEVEAVPQNSKSKTWVEYKFKQMPVAALFPMMGKLQSDAKSSATAVMNWSAEKMNAQAIVFDAFQPAFSAEKSYVIAGEKFSADIFLSAFSTTADNVSISVNGSGLPLKDGIAHFEQTASGLGEKPFKVSINVKNPLTGEVKNYSKDFKYEVGQRAVAISLDKMNVFYIGVENPISVSAAGVATKDINVSASGVSLSPNGSGKYIVKATTPGEASITVSGGGASQKFTYRVKRIPDPVPTLGMKHRGGQMGNGEFKAQGGIIPKLENFDFEAKCDVVGFEFTYLAKRQDPITEQNSGARWSGAVGGMIQKAKPGDAYFFDAIKVRCPGDAAARNIGGLAFKIK
jgi:gliding motility-associated protein GldM